MVVLSWSMRTTRPETTPDLCLDVVVGTREAAVTGTRWLTWLCSEGPCHADDRRERDGVWSTPSKGPVSQSSSSTVPQRSAAWNRQLPAFASTYRTVAYSCRSHRPHEHPPAGVAVTLDTHVDDLVGLQRALDLTPAHLIGASNGGFVGLLLARRMPGLVRTLVLADPPVLPLLGVSVPPRPSRHARQHRAARAPRPSHWSANRSDSRGLETSARPRISCAAEVLRAL